MSGQVLWVSKNGDFVAVSGFFMFFQYDVTSSSVRMRYTFVIEVSSSIYGMEQNQVGFDGKTSRLKMIEMIRKTHHF